MFPPVEELILLKGVCRGGPVAAFLAAVRGDDAEKYAEAYAALLETGSQRQFARHIADAVRREDSLFARQSFRGAPDADVRAAFCRDLGILRQVADLADDLPPRLRALTEKGFPAIGRGEDDPLLGSGGADAAEHFYRENGYGIFLGSKAFTFEGGSLVPVRNTASVLPEDLKDYEEEKNAVEENIVNFIEGLPYADMLLYGDKGTGKSSTVHAMLNRYAPRGLRAVELPKDRIMDIDALKEALAPLPFKFLIFIDDLSLEEEDEKVSFLKASLEGSMHETSDNVMIAATSNRRHILKEKFSDRDNSVHASDTMAEQLSLSDRFGLTVLFSSTGKAAYLSIVRQLAEDRKLGIREEELYALAERWALAKGGRSPRRARQFVDYAYACKVKDIPVRF